MSLSAQHLDLPGTWCAFSKYCWRNQTSESTFRTRVSAPKCPYPCGGSRLSVPVLPFPCEYTRVDVPMWVYLTVHTRVGVPELPDPCG